MPRLGSGHKTRHTCAGEECCVVHLVFGLVLLLFIQLADASGSLADERGITIGLALLRNLNGAADILSSLVSMVSNFSKRC